jgi:hypothetical protein
MRINKMSMVHKLNKTFHSTNGLVRTFSKVENVIYLSKKSYATENAESDEGSSEGF